MTNRYTGVMGIEAHRDLRSRNTGWQRTLGRALLWWSVLGTPACGGGIPLNEQVSPGKILGLLGVLILFLLIGLYGARNKD